LSRGKHRSHQSRLTITAVKDKSEMAEKAQERESQQQESPEPIGALGVPGQHPPKN
jgi:hypothetical protein